ncbi:TetR/AcrR family transcriptional regulator [Micrococcus luteus]|nr:TetR/AcrR family transcriptional regulator [Micrococcus luteus]MCV7740502.1 TetR/AcrR family transcriptional regulator [Micrococcus luteus]
MASLRQRNRQAAMEHIQQVAMELFDAHGYQAVTISQITTAAGVSDSTFYRLFQTKEGLFTATPWEPGDEPFSDLDPDHLAEGLRGLASGFEWKGLRWVIEEPAVRRAVLASLDMLAGQLIEALASTGRPRLEAGVEVRSLLFGAYLTGLEQWHMGGQEYPFETYFTRALTSTGD